LRIGLLYKELPQNQIAGIQTRYEYRVWEDSLTGVRSKLERLAPLLRTETTEDVYLISLTTDVCNAKIRGGRINIKVLLAVKHGLELWKPVMDAEFPLDRSAIAEQILPVFELPVPYLGRPQYSIDEFVNEVIRVHPKIVMMTTLKRRARFRLNECLAEFASVTIGDVTRETVALESTAVDPVLRLIQQLQIEGRPNVSYVRQLKQQLGVRQ
jgi:hypothetical protein